MEDSGFPFESVKSIENLLESQDPFPRKNIKAATT